MKIKQSHESKGQNQPYLVSILTYELGIIYIYINNWLGLDIKVFSIWTLGKNMNIQMLFKETYQVSLYSNLHALGYPKVWTWVRGQSYTC